MKKNPEGGSTLMPRLIERTILAFLMAMLLPPYAHAREPARARPGSSKGPAAIQRLGKEITVSKSAALLSLDFEHHEWVFASHGKYRLVRDPRGISQVYHPWDVAAEGDYGAISTRVLVPAEWQAPLFLNLY